MVSVGRTGSWETWSHAAFLMSGGRLPCLACPGLKICDSNLCLSEPVSKPSSSLEDTSH